MSNKKPSAKKPRAKKPSAKSVSGRGDLIIIDSARVGSSPRQGEVLEVISGEVTVSYLVRWADGRQTLIS